MKCVYICIYIYDTSLECSFCCPPNTYSLRAPLSGSASVVIWPLWWFVFHTILACTWRENPICTCCHVKRLSLARVRIRSFLTMSELNIVIFWECGIGTVLARNSESPTQERWAWLVFPHSSAWLEADFFWVYMFTFTDEVCELFGVPLNSLLCSCLLFLVMECPSVCHQGSLGDGVS